MSDASAARQFGNRADVRPSPDERCAECGISVGDGWVYYSQDSADPQSLIRHFGGIISNGPVEPRPEVPTQPSRDFHYPEDLEVFFHTSCAPRVKLPEKVQEEINKLLARCVVAYLEKTSIRWAKVRQLPSSELDLPKFHAQVASVVGRRVF